MEILGFIVMVGISLGVTVVPFLIIAVSAWSGEMSWWELTAAILVWIVAAVLWWLTLTNSPFTILVN